MARKVRFPLKMKNGVEVRTLSELQENFDLEAVLGYFAEGKLKTWLEHRCEEEKAEAVGALSVDTPDLTEKLCKILGIEYQDDSNETDMELIQRRNEKLRILKAETDDRTLIDNVDIVALNQDDLYDILDTSDSPQIYLYQGVYYIPFGKKNIQYIGINNPEVQLDKEHTIEDYNSSKIYFLNIKLPVSLEVKTESIQSTCCTTCESERLFLQGKYMEAFGIAMKDARDGNPRAKFIMALYYNDGYSVASVNKKKRYEYVEDYRKYNDPFLTFGFAFLFMKTASNMRDKLYSSIYPDIKEYADRGHPLAQFILGYMYENRLGVYVNHTLFSKKRPVLDPVSASTWYKKSADQGCAMAQYYLGKHYIYSNRSEAIEWFRKAAQQGHSAAIKALETMHVRVN